MKFMLKSNEILIGQGILDLKFGASRDQARQVLGHPDRVEMIDYLNDSINVAEVWVFDDLGLSASFDGSNGFRLESLESESPELVLGGMPIIGKSQEVVLRMLQTADNATTPLIEEVAGIQFIDYVNLGMMLLFDETGLYKLLSWSHLWKDNNTPIWPE